MTIEGNYQCPQCWCELEEKDQEHDCKVDE